MCTFSEPSSNETGRSAALTDPRRGRPTKPDILLLCRDLWFMKTQPWSCHTCILASSAARGSRYGSGWIPWGDDAADLEVGITRMRAAVAERGRDPGGLGVVGTIRGVKDDNGDLDLAQTMEPVPKLHEAGVTDFRIALKPSRGEQAALDYLGEVVTAFRSATA